MSRLQCGLLSQTPGRGSSVTDALGRSKIAGMFPSHTKFSCWEGDGRVAKYARYE